MLPKAHLLCIPGCLALDGWSHIVFIWVMKIFLYHSSMYFVYQCREIEENNWLGKTRDLFKKITDTKGTFYAKTGTIKDINGKALTDAEEIKKKWQEYTELYQESFNDQDN